MTDKFDYGISIYLVIIIFLPEFKLIIDFQMEIFFHSVVKVRSAIGLDQDWFPGSLRCTVLWSWNVEKPWLGLVG